MDPDPRALLFSFSYLTLAFYLMIVIGRRSKVSTSIWFRDSNWQCRVTLLLIPSGADRVLLGLWFMVDHAL